MQVGALTFLFTDIEASTRRWEADPAEMSAALTRHDETLRRAITAAGGSVFKHTGDGMCAVFPSATAALFGALAAQHRFAGDALRVRMAVHSGDAEQRNDDYFGPTLNRAARLMAAAWGGQTLVSAATAELVGDQLPPDGSLVDLGEHRLADLSRPERIFQLCGGELAADFPPIRTVSVRRHNLPLVLTSFVGRERELGELGDLIKMSRLVTVAGVGGAGKTRLAVETATRALDGFPDGVFLVELAAVTDPALVPATVAAALGLLLDRPEPLSDQLARYLEQRAPLILLDNCEHVVDAAAGLAAMLTRMAAGVTLLATSREPLGVPGEVVWRIPPLDHTEAFELVCQRARSADPSFSPSETDVPALERICTRLDGMPLALELAAARLHLLSPAEIAARLDDRFRILTGGARTAVDRHRTLRATIDWGYDLLDEPGRALLRRLSVFAGGFDLAAAEAVAGPDALDPLSGLVDRSWVAVDPPDVGPTRYRLIETIRQYAAEKLAEAGEADGARRAHCRHFQTLAENRPDPIGIDPTWLRWSRLEEDNVRAALEWAEGKGDHEACLDLASATISYFAFNGRGSEGRLLVERALAVDPGDRSKRRLVALWLLGAYLPLAAESEAGENVLQQALDLAESTEKGLAPTIRTSLARALARRDPDRAKALVGRDIVRSGSLQEGAWAALNHGWVWLAAGDREAAEAWFSRALELTDNIVHTIHAGAALAPLCAARGDAGRATALAAEAIEQARELDLPIVLVMALTRAAEASILLGQPVAAAHRLAESTRILREVGTHAWVGETLKLAAVVATHNGHDSVATRLLAAAQAVDTPGPAVAVDDALSLALSESLAAAAESGPA